MKRRLVIAMMLATLVHFAWADDESTDEDRVSRVRQDLELIEAFVEGGLALAKEGDPLRRAHTCNAMASQVARDLKKAGDGKDARRVAVLSEFMKSVLVRGVAKNLQQASDEATKETVRAREIAKFAGVVSAEVAPLEKTLKKALDALPDSTGKDAMLPAIEGISRARAEVESISLGKGKSTEKGFKGKGKGKMKW